MDSAAAELRWIPRFMVRLPRCPTNGVHFSTQILSRLRKIDQETEFATQMEYRCIDFRDMRIITIHKREPQNCLAN